MFCLHAFVLCSCAEVGLLERGASLNYVLSQILQHTFTAVFSNRTASILTMRKFCFRTIMVFVVTIMFPSIKQNKVTLYILHFENIAKPVKCSAVISRLPLHDWKQIVCIFVFAIKKNVVTCKTLLCYPVLYFCSSKEDIHDDDADFEQDENATKISKHNVQLERTLIY